MNYEIPLEDLVPFSNLLSIKIFFIETKKQYLNRCKNKSDLQAVLNNNLTLLLPFEV